MTDRKSTDPTAPALTVQGHPVTAEQRDAGLAAMRGRFYRDTVWVEVAAAIWPNVLLDPDQIAIMDRITDRLLQSERRAGRIRVVKGRGCWEAVS